MGLKRPRLDYTRVCYGLGQFIPRGILWPEGVCRQRRHTSGAHTSTYTAAMLTHTNTYKHAYKHTYKHTCTHTYTHICTHTSTYTLLYAKIVGKGWSFPS